MGPDNRSHRPVCRWNWGFVWGPFKHTHTEAHSWRLLTLWPLLGLRQCHWNNGSLKKRGPLIKQQISKHSYPAEREKSGLKCSVKWDCLQWQHKDTTHFTCWKQQTHKQSQGSDSLPPHFLRQYSLSFIIYLWEHSVTLSFSFNVNVSTNNSTQTNCVTTVYCLKTQLQSCNFYSL